MRKLLVIATVVAALAPATSSAWGPREQGALAGIAGTLLFQHITQPPPPPVYAPPPVYYQAPPVYVTPPPQYRPAPVYRIVEVYVPECNCYRRYIVPIE